MPKPTPEIDKEPCEACGAELVRGRDAEGRIELLRTWAARTWCYDSTKCRDFINGSNGEKVHFNSLAARKVFDPPMNSVIDRFCFAPSERAAGRA